MTFEVIPMIRSLVIFASVFAFVSCKARTTSGDDSQIMSDKKQEKKLFKTQLFCAGDFRGYSFDTLINGDSILVLGDKKTKFSGKCYQDASEDSKKIWKEHTKIADCVQNNGNKEYEVKIYRYQLKYWAMVLKLTDKLYVQKDRDIEFECKTTYQKEEDEIGSPQAPKSSGSSYYPQQGS